MSFFNEIEASGLGNFLLEKKVTRSASPVVKILLQKGDSEARFLVHENDRSFFIRFTTQLNEYKLTAELNNYLYEQGHSVIPVIVYGESFLYKGIDYRVDVRPFIAGRPYNGSMEDFTALLKVIHPIHRSLQKFPASTEVQRTASVFTSTLDNARERLRNADQEISGEAGTWLKENSAFIKEHLLSFDVSMGLNSGAQALHGDLHSGNVLFGTDNAFIFDFEESYKVYLNRAYDLAYLLERFCLQGSDDKEFYKRFDLLSRTYDLEYSLDRMLDIISGMSLRLILIVWTNYFEKGVEVPVQELNKFINNHSRIISFKTKIL